MWLANTFFGAVEKQAASEVAVQGTVRILAAKQDVAFGDTISAENTSLVDWPAASVPQGAVMEDKAQAFIAQNNAAVRSLVPGEPILQSNLASRAVLSATIPQNQRAVSIPLDAVTGVAGFIAPGDIVDVVLTRSIPGSGATAEEQMATIVLQNVPVLAIDTQASEKAQPAADGESGDKVKLETATLMVDALGAQKIALATQVGKLTLVLRNGKDRAPIMAATVLPRDLGGAGVRVSRPAAQTGAAPVRRAAAPRAAQTTTAAPPPPFRRTMSVLRGTQESVESVMTNGY